MVDRWVVGAAGYLVDEQEGDRRYIVGVRCCLGSLRTEELALLDTGAIWSVVGGDHSELLAADFDEDLEPIQISTRLGTFNGLLRRLRITLVADMGTNLEVDATVAECPLWPGPVILGYHGLMERVCIALDPGAEVGQAWLYFGRPGALLPSEECFLDSVD